MRVSKDLSFLGYPVEIMRKPWQRSLNMRVTPNGCIKITCARLTPKNALVHFILSHKKWLESSLAEYESLRAQYPKKKYCAGDVFIFLGEDRILKLLNSKKKWPHVEVHGSELRLYSSQELSLSERAEVLRKFYCKQGREILESRIHVFSERMGLYPKALSFRSQKTRWGSCSSEGNISLNWRLVAASIGVIDYVVIHELAHLRHQNHSKLFWSLVERYCPHYRIHRKWLRTNMYEFDFLAKASELHPL